MGVFYTIPPTLNFSAILAQHCDDLAAQKNIPLSKIKIYLPTRRAARSLQDAFLQHSNGKPRLLPLMQSIGDADLEEAGFYDPQAADIPPAISPLHRQMVLARLLTTAFPDLYDYHNALPVAAALGHLIDQIHTESLSVDGLKTLTEMQDFAKYWKITVHFLTLILGDHWPAFLQEQGMIDPGLHRRLRIESLTDFYNENKIEYPVIMAGSTGSIPATRAFIKTLSSLENGQVILPGLDMQSDDKYWLEISDGHPQFLMKQLLEVCKIKRSAVTALQPDPNISRSCLSAEMMRPAVISDQWQGLDPDSIHRGLENITLCEGENDHHEATTIAVAMAEIAHDSDQKKTATLITPDRNLAMRVQSILKFWSIDSDDSAGTSLTNTALGRFCLSILQVIDSGTIDPVALMGLLKNPCCKIFNRRDTEKLERDIFRGLRPKGLFQDLIPYHENHKNILETLHDIFESLIALKDEKNNLCTLVQSHLKIMEHLAGGADDLWITDSGEAMASLFTELQMHYNAVPLLTLENYHGFITQILTATQLTARYGKHPRLSILGQIESRMVQADRVILAGLNEGVWPPDNGFDVWMSRAMRTEFGLPSLEQKTTLAAHDFASGFCASEVFITRSKKSNGQPTLPSRWLQRLETILIAAGIPDDCHPAEKGKFYCHWADHFRLAQDYRPIARPAPKPLLSQRPTEFSVTEIEKWMRDPYWIFAKKILKLRRLDHLDRPLSVADRGSLIHTIMEDFIAKYNNGILPEQALQDFIALAEKQFKAMPDDPQIQNLWWAHFIKKAHKIMDYERDWRKDTQSIFVEQTGEFLFSLQGREYSLKCKADRIEKRINNKTAIIDYKTGSPPTPADIAAGLASQLILEALIIRKNGFETISGDNDFHLSYWVLGGSQKSESLTVKDINLDTINDLITAAEDGLHALIQSFQNDETPYLASPDPTIAMKIAYNDYAHLERISEWSVTDGGNGDE